MTAGCARRKVFSQPSWILQSSTVQACLTETGGHLGPVTFDRRGRKIQPYHVAPWHAEKLERGTPPILRVLRGDFFCMPFGGNITAFGREKHPVHGETANARWALESVTRDGGMTCLHASLRTRIRRGRVDKYIVLADGHNAVYCRHVISEMSGPMNLGHHANLRFPDAPGSGLLSFSPWRFGQVWLEPTENPEQRGYSILKPGARFERLDRVPMITGEYTDLGQYPARRGFEDIVHLIADPRTPIAWTAVTFPAERYVWFALKDPRVLNGTLLWMSNGGRHYPPWNGRHVNVMGLEELTSFFHTGLAESARANAHTRRGIPTVLKLDPQRPTVVNYVMAVAAVPTGFDRVKRIEPDTGRVTLIAASGRKVTVPLDEAFVLSGR